MMFKLFNKLTCDNLLARDGRERWVMRSSLISGILCSICLLLLVAGRASGQPLDNVKVTVGSHQISLAAILSAVKEQSLYTFVYNADEVSKAGNVTLASTTVSLEDLINVQLKRLGYNVKINGYNLLLIKNRNAGRSVKKEDLVQQETISGIVLDDSGRPLEGVNIRVKGTEIATASRKDGRFAISWIGDKSAAVLVISSIGFTLQEIPLIGKSELTIRLVNENNQLEDVVVVGYGTLRKSDLTGAVASVSGKELNEFPVTSLISGIQGKATGVQVLQNSGAPGGNVSVRIRGGNSLVGNNEPLYVVDGFALSGTPNALNPQDILSIEILKDASASAIYGSRGANGVVLITTKKGKVGKSEVSVESYLSIQKLRKKIDLMDATEFAELANERAANDGEPAFFTPEQINSFGKGTDWQDVLYRTAPQQNHAVNVSGGTENTLYAISANYLGQGGIVKGSDMNKESLRANLEQKISHTLRITYNATLTNTDLSKVNSDNGSKGSTIINGLLGAPPTIAPFDKDGNYSNLQAYSFSPNNLINPLALAVERTQKINEKYILANTAVSYEPIKHLIFKSSIGIESVNSREDIYSPSIIYTTPKGQASINSTNGMNILNENIVTYHVNFHEDHQLSLLAGFTYQQSRSKSFGTGSATGFASDELGTQNIQSASVPGTPQSSASRWYLLSYLARANYSFKDTYLLTASIRSDGSSRFGPGHKWGYFPSAAFAWRAINKDFLHEQSVLSDLKIRLSWGLTGSTAVTPYQSINTLSSFQNVFNDELYIGYAPSLTDFANPDLKWETTAQADAGIDLSFLRNRLSVTIDYYRKDTRDLLANIPLPTSSGYATTLRNIGKIRNSGLELGLNALVFDRAFKWNLQVNVSKNRNKVIALTGGRDDIFGVQMPQPLEASVNLVRVGEPVGVFYGYVEDGLNTDGTIKYKDLDGVAGITTADRTIIGNPNPGFYYNVGSDLSYKQLDFLFQFQGVQDVDIFNQNLAAQANSFWWGENQLQDLYDHHWSASSPDQQAKYPRISSKNVYLPSDRFVENGSFLRLRNIQVAYNIPLKKVAATWLKNIQIYISGQNLITITDYSGYDPEVSTRGGANSISPGIDQSGYPNSKSYTAGARITL